MKQGLSLQSKIFIILTIVGISGLLFFGWPAFGDTVLNLTLDRSGTELERGLVGHWTFDGKDMVTNVADTSGQGNDGSLILGSSGNTSTTTAAGAIGQGLEFDGDDDYVETTSAPVTGSQNRTVALWVKPSAAEISSGNATNILEWGANSTGNRYTVKKAASNDVRIEIEGSGYTTSLGLTANEWHFIAFVLDGNTLGDNTIYLNTSSEQASGAGTIDTLSTNPVNIGRSFGFADQEFGGVIDDVRIYDRALSAKEVERLYNLGATTKLNVTLERSNTESESGLVGHWTFDGKDTATNIADTSGQGNHGSLILGSSGNTSTTTAFGKIGQALEFDGADDYVDVGNAAVFDITGAVTISAWVKADDLAGGFEVVLTKGRTFASDGDSAQGPFFLAADSARPNFSIVNSSDIRSELAGSSLSTDTWYHLVAVWDGTTGTDNQRIYVNGELDTSGSQTSVSSLKTNNKSIELGRDQDRSADDRMKWDGVIDDVRVYNRELSDEEIKRLYQLGATTKINTTFEQGNTESESGLVAHYTMDGKDTATNIADISGQGNHGKLQGQTSTTTAFGVIGQALEFDGIGGGGHRYVDVPDSSSLDVSTAVSVATWVRPSDCTQPISGEVRSLAGKWDNSATQRSYILALSRNEDTCNITFQISDDGAWNTDAANGVISTDTLSVDEWAHVVGTYHGPSRVATIYIDGEFENSNTLSDPDTDNIHNSDSALYIAATENWLNGDSEFAGALDDVRVYNRELSPKEVKRLYQMGR